MHVQGMLAQILPPKCQKLLTNHSVPPHHSTVLVREASKTAANCPNNTQCQIPNSVLSHPFSITDSTKMLRDGEFPVHLMTVPDDSRAKSTI